MKRHQCKVELMNILFWMIKGMLCLAASAAETHTHAHTQETAFEVKFIDDGILPAYEKWAFLLSHCYPALTVAAAANGSPPSTSQHAAPASGEKYLNQLEEWFPPEGTDRKVKRTQIEIPLLQPPAVLIRPENSCIWEIYRETSVLQHVKALLLTAGITVKHLFFLFKVFACFIFHFLCSIMTKNCSVWCFVCSSRVAPTGRSWMIEEEQLRAVLKEIVVFWWRSTAPRPPLSKVWFMNS